MSDWLPLNEYTIRQTGSIVNDDRFPFEDAENVPGPLVTGVKVPFNGKLDGGGMGLHPVFPHCTDPKNWSLILSMSRSTEMPPEGSF
jgi:hypothetical protein